MEKKRKYKLPLLITDFICCTMTHQLIPKKRREICNSGSYNKRSKMKKTLNQSASEKLERIFMMEGSYYRKLTHKPYEPV